MGGVAVGKYISGDEMGRKTRCLMWIGSRGGENG